MYTVPVHLFRLCVLCAPASAGVIPSSASAEVGKGNIAVKAPWPPPETTGPGPHPTPELVEGGENVDIDIDQTTNTLTV